jgi:hypothetical protein
LFFVSVSGVFLCSFFSFKIETCADCVLWVRKVSLLW